MQRLWGNTYRTNVLPLFIKKKKLIKIFVNDLTPVLCTSKVTSGSASVVLVHVRRLIPAAIFVFISSLFTVSSAWRSWFGTFNGRNSLIITCSMRHMYNRFNDFLLFSLQQISALSHGRRKHVLAVVEAFDF